MLNRNLSNADIASIEQELPPSFLLSKLKSRLALLPTRSRWVDIVVSAVFVAPSHLEYSPGLEQLFCTTCREDDSRFSVVVAIGGFVVGQVTRKLRRANICSTVTTITAVCDVAVQARVQ